MFSYHYERVLRMVIYDAFYLMQIFKIIDYFQFQYNTKSSFENSIICIPPKINKPRNDFVWAGYDCEIMRNRLFCNLCEHDGARRLFGSPYHGSIAIHGSTIAESFVPCVETIVTECFVESLKLTEFSGFDFLALEVFNYTTKVQPDIYLLECNGNAYDISYQRNIAEKYPSYCANCHWGPQECPKCLGIVTKCPKCECLDFECNTLDIEKSLQPQRIELTYLGDIESYLPLSCEHWDGTDFITALEKKILQKNSTFSILLRIGIHEQQTWKFFGSVTQASSRGRVDSQGI